MLPCSEVFGIAKSTKNVNVERLHVKILCITSFKMFTRIFAKYLELYVVLDAKR
jgi:hypothetical protein